MTRCAVCHQEVIVVKTDSDSKKRRRPTHTYCRWRAYNFLRHDLWSVFTFFILSFVCFLFLILAGSIGNDVILRNTAYLVLVWTVLFTLWLLWINYLKMVRQCCKHYGKKYRFWKRRSFEEDEIVTEKDVIE